MPSFKQWFLETESQAPEGFNTPETNHHHTHPWWKVMCLTGVDYFSTLGYQPGIAALAAGAISPFATLVLVLLTLFGALPMYRRVAGESPHGDGSISMLANLLPFWQGKIFTLCLIGFAVTGFIITITLSAADASAHLIENPFAPHWMHGQNVIITLCLIGLLGAVFLKGFGEAIGIAVALVVVYILLNLIVLGRGLIEIWSHPSALALWKTHLATDFPNPLAIIGASLLVFPKLALGLSGFETGVVVMPLIRGEAGDTEENPAGRIKNGRKLLTTAALIMSVLLITSSLVTTILIPHEQFAAPNLATGAPAGKAYGRALAYVAHTYLGDFFGTLYDASTITILWFAGSSAMAGLLNIVPRYLPRYGMAPEWTRSMRPLSVIFTVISFAVTLAFHAGVEAQAGAYATGVLALMTSATIAVTLSAWRKRQTKMLIGFGIVTLIFLYTTANTIWERPEGLKIALVFIASIIVISFLSRVLRTTELRVERVELDELAQQFVAEAAGRGIRIIANKRQEGDEREYALKEDRQREDSHIPASLPILFVEVEVTDASDFSSSLQVQGVQVGDYRILRAKSATVPNAIAALLLHLREVTGKRPHAYFDWSEGNPLVFMMRYLLLGEGDTAPVTREVLRKTERNKELRPMIHVDG